MQKLIFFIVSLTIALSGYAQESANDTTHNWKYGGSGSVNFSQVALKNWASGGESSYSLNNFFSVYANYSKDKVSWENSLDIGYGIIKEENRDVKKTDDKIDFSSKYGYQASKNWFYSGAFTFRTQFAEGYKFKDDDSKVLISDFMAPAYAIFSAGMTYKPSENFNVLISPVTGKTTMVFNDALSQAGAFGVNEGDNWRYEFGGFVKLMYTTDIMENVTLKTKMDYFSNYIEEPTNIDVNIEVNLAMKINDYLSANISSQILYDDDVKYVDNDGVEHGPRIQFKEVAGLGFSFKF